MKQLILFRQIIAGILLLAVSTLSWAYDFEVDGNYYNINTGGTSVTVTNNTDDFPLVTINLTEAGMLQDKLLDLDDTDIRRLKLSGFITASDVSYLRSSARFANLKYLDISEVTLVPSNEPYAEFGIYVKYGNGGTTGGSSARFYISEEENNELIYSESNGLGGANQMNAYYSRNLAGAFTGMNLEYVILPRSFDRVGAFCFKGCKKLQEVSLPNNNGFKYIDEFAFTGCESLEKLLLPSSVVFIGAGAFYECKMLNNVGRLDNVKFLGKSSFAYCESLRNVGSLASVEILDYGTSSLGVSCFKGCTSLVGDVETGILDLSSCNNIPEARYYGDGTFSGCSSIQEVKFSKDLKSIGSYAFLECTNLSIITLPDGLEKIGTSAFSSCSNLKTASIPNSLLHVGYDTFSNTPFEQTFELDNGVWYMKDIAMSVSSFSSISFREGTRSIADGFYNTMHAPYQSAQPENCKSITLPSTLKCIGEESFQGVGITSLFLPESLNYIGAYAFDDCTSLSGTLTIPENVSFVGANAFAHCSGLVAVKYNANSRESDYSAFSGCTGLEKVTIGPKVEVIPKDAFNRSSIYKLVFTERTDATKLFIGNQAFFENNNIKEIVLPYGTDSIGIQAFCTCRSLTNVTIPNTVTYIGKSAFYGCIGVKNVVCQALKIPTTDSDCFYGIAMSSATLFVPKSSISAYKTTKPWSSFGTILPIEDGETSYNITATANPSSGGSITGVGAYQDGATVTMTATPASGYEFIKWTENGTAVSTQATYIFTATQDRTLVANFKKVDEGNNVISDVSQLSNDKCYYLYTKDKLRGGLGVNTDYGSIASTFSVTNAKYKTGSVTPFLVFYYNDNFYLYSVEANAFVTYSGGLTRTNITEENAVNITRNSNGYFMISFVATRRVLNINTNPGLAINNWGTSVEEYDEGNQFTIEVAGDFDSSVIVDLINEPNTTSDEDFEHYAQTPVQGMNELVNAQVYTAVTRRAAWYVPASGTRLESTVRPIAERWHCSDAGQQFAFIQHNGQYYIYSVGEKKILNGITNNSPNKGMLVTEDCQPVNIMPTHDTQYPLYFSFGESYNVNIDDSGMVTIDSWTTMDDGNKVALRPVQDVMLSEADIKRIIGYIKGFIPGDVNGDGDVNGADIVAVINYVLNDSKTYGDVNGDGEVNGADIVSTINYVLSYTSDASRQQTFYAHRAPERQADTCDCLSGNIDANGFSIGLTNEIDFTAFQFMLQLPDGCELTNISADASRLDSHALQYRRIADGRYLVLGYNMENEKITGEDGTLLHLQLAGNMCESASVTDVLFFTPKAKTYCLAGLHIDLVTGLTSLDNATEDVTGNVYDVYGRIVMTAGQYAKQKNLLPEGIYIRNGRKFIVK